jgi:RimJ/RimL family protein N-acetyltransferase
MELRLLTVDDADDVAELIAEPDVLRFTRIPEPPPHDFARTWCAGYERRRAAGEAEAFAIVGEDGGFLGLALAPVIEREAAQAELGYIVAAHATGRGVATAALEHMTRWAFDELGMQRLTLMIDVENPASKRVAERAGYRLEGVMRSTYVKQGRRADTELWSRLPGDPAPVTTAR